MVVKRKTVIEKRDENDAYKKELKTPQNYKADNSNIKHQEERNRFINI